MMNGVLMYSPMMVRSIVMFSGLNTLVSFIQFICVDLFGHYIIYIYIYVYYHLLDIEVPVEAQVQQNDDIEDGKDNNSDSFHL